MTLRIPYSSLYLSLCFFLNFTSLCYPKSIKNPHLTSHTFFRYVRPQIRNIVNEYFFVIKQYVPAKANLINLRQKILKLSTIWEDKKNTTKCLNRSPECKDLLKITYQRSGLIDREIFKLLKGNHFKHKKNHHADMDNKLNLYANIYGLSNLNFTILRILEKHLIMLDTPYDNSFNSFYLKDLLRRLLVLSEVSLISSIKTNVGKEFDFLWANFIKQLENQILIKKNPLFLMKNLKDLNITWNSFHRNLTKSKSNLTKTDLKVIKIMHNRWNSILKITLKN